MGYRELSKAPFSTSHAFRQKMALSVSIHVFEVVLKLTNITWVV